MRLIGDEIFLLCVIGKSSKIVKGSVGKLVSSGILQYSHRHVDGPKENPGSKGRSEGVRKTCQKCQKDRDLWLLILCVRVSIAKRHRLLVVSSLVSMLRCSFVFLFGPRTTSSCIHRKTLKPDISPSLRDLLSLTGEPHLAGFL